jgi:hypothetical protein
MPRKCLLILADDGKWISEMLRAAARKVDVGENLSVHVQAAIVTWEYVRRYLLEEG